MSQIYIKNAYILTMNKKKEAYTQGDILIENDKFKAVGKVNPEDVQPHAQKVDAKGKIVMPGLINTHVHTSQQLERGLGDDVDLLTWLHERTFPYESSLTPEDSYVSTLLCMLEQIRSGVTAFTEAGGQFVGSMARAVSESGIRGILSKSSMDCGEGLPEVWQKTTDEELDVQVDNVERYHNTADGRIRVWFALRTLFNNTDELVVRTKELTDKYGVGYTMHVAEAKSEVDYVKATKAPKSVVFTTLPT
jgi:5-methylthioadenosine/S-adenosylhomocysteine deaminase